MANKITPTNAKRRDMAKILYTQAYHSVTEIAERLWTTKEDKGTARAKAIHRGEKLLRGWIKEGAWDDLRTSLSVTRDSNIRNLYLQLSTINNNIAAREPSERVATKEEAERLAKIADIISKLETEIGITEIVNTGMQFIDWIKTHDIGAAKEICQYWDEFLKFKMCG